MLFLLDLHPVPSNCPRREREHTTSLQRHPRKWQGGLTVLCERGDCVMWQSRDCHLTVMCHATIMWLVTWLWCAMWQSCDCHLIVMCRVTVPTSPLQMDASVEEGIRAVTLGAWERTFLMCFECAHWSNNDCYFYWVCIISAAIIQIHHHCLCVCVCVQFAQLLEVYDFNSISDLYTVCVLHCVCMDNIYNYA